MKAIVCACLLIATFQILAQANPVSFNFTGSVSGPDFWNAPIGFNVAPGDPIRGTLEYNWAPLVSFATGTFTLTAGAETDTEPAFFRWAGTQLVQPGNPFILMSSVFKDTEVSFYLDSANQNGCSWVTNTCPSLPTTGFAWSELELRQNRTGYIDPSDPPLPTDTRFLNAGGFQFSPQINNPEPGTWILLLTGLAGVVVAKWKRL
jgi:hypothetical protein